MGAVSKTYELADCSRPEVVKWFQNNRALEEHEYGADAYSGSLATVYDISVETIPPFKSQQEAHDWLEARTEKRAASAVRFHDVKQVLVGKPTFGKKTGCFHTNSYDYKYSRKERVFVPADQLTDKQKKVFTQRHEDYQGALEILNRHNKTFQYWIDQMKRADQEFGVESWKHLKRARNDTTRAKRAYDKAKKSFDSTNSGHRKKLYKYETQNDGIKWLVLAVCAC